MQPQDDDKQPVKEFFPASEVTNCVTPWVKATQAQLFSDVSRSTGWRSTFFVPCQVFCHQWIKSSPCKYLYGFLSLDINYHYSILLRLCHINVLVSDIDCWSPCAGLSAFTFHSRTDLFLRVKKKKKRRKGLISTSSGTEAARSLALKNIGKKFPGDSIRMVFSPFLSWKTWNNFLSGTTLQPSSTQWH